MKIGYEQTLDDAEWRALLDADPNATFFHTPAWLGALTGSYPYYRLRWITARMPDGLLRGSLPVIESQRGGARQLLSLPYGTYGGPVALGADSAERGETRGALLAGWWASTGGIGVARAQLALFTPPEGDPPVSWPGAVACVTERTHLVDLRPGFDHLWSEVFDGDVRTCCRKAEKAGVTVLEDRGPEDIRALDALYRAQATGWVDHTPFPPGLFSGMRERAPENVQVWMARHDGAAVAGLLAVRTGGMVMAWLAPSSPDARRLNAMPLLYRHVMEHAITRGDRFFNFGGSRNAPGLESFKEGLGGRPLDYPLCLREAAWFRPLRLLQYRLRGIRD